MNVILMLLNMAYLGTTGSVDTVPYISQGSCSPEQQRDILITSCQIRETLVDLREHMPNAINVIPDFATVNRCGGSCDLYSNRCIPTATKTKRLDVMVVLSETETECGYVEVEEHVGCKCDCPLQPHHCHSYQYYEPSSCRCLCRRDMARQCIMNGMQWDPLNCMCMCPMASWEICSTSYMFDFIHTCQCMPISTIDLIRLVVAIIVLLTFIVMSVVGLYLMYRHQIGLFGSRSRRSTMPRNLNDYDLINDIVKDEKNIIQQRLNMSAIIGSENLQ